MFKVSIHQEENLKTWMHLIICFQIYKVKIGNQIENDTRWKSGSSQKMKGTGNDKYVYKYKMPFYYLNLF